MRSFATILLSLSLPLHAFAAHGINPARRHADIALRPRDSFSGVRMTYYEITVGPVACEGGHYSDSDFVVALNHPQFGDGAGTSSYCGQIITISYEGKSAQATIVDECMGCPYGGLDLTPGLFSYLAGGTSQGVIQADWSSGGAAPAPAPAPTTSSTPPPPPPTTHYTPPPTTSSPPPPPSSTSTSTSTTSKTSSSVSSATPTTSHKPSSSTSSASQTPSNAGYNNPPASNAAQPSGTLDSNGQSQSIELLYEAIINMGTVVLAVNP